MGEDLLSLGPATSVVRPPVADQSSQAGTAQLKLKVFLERYYDFTPWMPIAPISMNSVRNNEDPETDQGNDLQCGPGQPDDAEISGR